VEEEELVSIEKRDRKGVNDHKGKIVTPRVHWSDQWPRVKPWQI
jgi:hypothetical protein